jgi:hypothetical protein
LPVADGVTCEVYRRATRYIVMTGNQFNDAGLSNIDDAIDEVLAELDQPKKPEPRHTKATTKKQLPQELRIMLHAQGDSPAGYASRSELFWAFICTALRKGTDENLIVAACLDTAYAGLSIYNHVQDKGGEAYVKEQIKHALEKAMRDGNKWIIQLTPDTLDQAWRATERALLSERCPVYVRGGNLVQPLWREEKTDGNRTALTAKFVRYNVPRLRDVVAHHAAIFQKQMKGKWQNIDPPKDVIEALLEMGHWGFPTVAGGSSTLRPCGPTAVCSLSRATTRRPNFGTSRVKILLSYRQSRTTPLRKMQLKH